MPTSSVNLGGDQKLVLFFKFLGDSDIQPGCEPLLFLVPLMDFIWHFWVFLSFLEDLSSRVFLFVKSSFLVGFQPHFPELHLSRSLSLLSLTQQLSSFRLGGTPSWLEILSPLDLGNVGLSDLSDSSNSAPLQAPPPMPHSSSSLCWSPCRASFSVWATFCLSMILLRQMAFNTIHIVCSPCSTNTNS